MSQLGVNPYLLNIVPLFNIADPNNATVSDVASALSNFQTVLNTTTQTLFINSIQPYSEGSNVSMIGDFNVTGAFTVNGNSVVVNESGSNVVTGTSYTIDLGGAGAQFISTGSAQPNTAAVSFQVNSNSVFEIDGLGRALYQGDGVTSNVNRLWVSSAILHADRAAIGLGGLSTMSTSFDVWGGDAYFNCNVHVKGDVFADNFINLSDRRIKSNIRPVEGALSTICALQGVHYTLKGAPSLGFIAQEVQEVIPEAVHPRPDGLLAVDYNKILPFLVEAVKEIALHR
jgi:hypothetical protein